VLKALRNARLLGGTARQRLPGPFERSTVAHTFGAVDDVVVCGGPPLQADAAAGAALTQQPC
jgi:hypothetical protein